MARKKVHRNVSKSSDESVPVGVKIISVLYYIGAAALVILGLLAIAGGGAFASLFEQLGFFQLSGGLFIFVGIVLIAFAVLSYCLGRGLWKAQNWARVIAAVFAILGFLDGFAQLLGGFIANGLFNVVIEGLICWYLLFNVRVKKAFA